MVVGALRESGLAIDVRERRIVAVVGRVETAPPEDHAHGLDDAPEAAPAGITLAEGRILKALPTLENGAALLATVYVGGHARLLEVVSHSWFRMCEMDQGDYSLRSRLFGCRLSDNTVIVV